MVKTLVALYGDVASAQRIIEALFEAGFSIDDVSMVVRGSSDADGDASIPDGARFGAVVGTLVGLGSALVPGMGPLIGDGPLAVAITAGVAAAAGALAGGIAAGVFNLSEGMTEASTPHARGAVITVTTQEQWLEWARMIMMRGQPINFEVRAAQERSSSWLTAAMLEPSGTKTDVPAAGKAGSSSTSMMRSGNYKYN